MPQYNKTTTNQIVFINVTAPRVANEPIILDFVPEDVSDDYSADFNSVKPLARANPIYIYTGGSDRSLSFSLKIHEDLLPNDIRFKTDGAPDLRKFINHIAALSYPVRLGGVIAPPRIYLKIGKFYSGFGYINTTISWSNIRDGRYTLADLKFSFTAESSVPHFVQDVIVGDLYQTNFARGIK